MSDVNSFDKLTHSGLLKANSKDDKNVTFQIDVYGGTVSFVVFTGAGGRPWKVTIPSQAIANMLILLRKMRANPATCREPIFIQDWDMENKKWKQVGQIGLGIDEASVVTIDIAHNQLQAPGGRFVFPIRNNAKFDFSNTSMSDKEAVQGILDNIISTLSLESTIASRLSGFKRAPGQQGGNKGGFSGGNRQYNNNNNGGGYNRNNNNQGNVSGGTFGGGGDADIENDLHV